MRTLWLVPAFCFAAIALAAGGDSGPQYWKRQAGPGGTELVIDGRLPFRVPRPEDLPLVGSGRMSLADLVAEGERRWFFEAQLEGEPFGVPAAVFDFYVGPTPVASRSQVYEALAPLLRMGLPMRAGEELPRGFVRTVNKDGVEVVTQNCSACHSGTVNGQLIPGVGNKWYNQRAIIANARTMMEASLPLLHAGGPASAETLAATERQLAKLRRYEALYSEACPDLGPGMITAARIWEISSKLLHDPAQLATPAGRKKFPCGATKPPPLNTLRFRNLLFWDSSVNSTWVAHWPMFDFFGFDDYDRWVKKVQSREIQAIDALVVFGTASPSWESVMKTPVDRAAAAAGYAIFHREQSCAGCHGTYGSEGMLQSFRPSITPLAVIGTDSERADAAHDDLMAEFAQYGWAFVPRLEGLQGYDPGYTTMPLCSTFLNFPYLHTAGAANLFELLLPEAERSSGYWLSDIINEKNVGFFTSQSLPKQLRRLPSHKVVRRNFSFDKVKGHSGPRFGTELNDAERLQLIEYLKTLRCPEEDGLRKK